MILDIYAPVVPLVSLGGIAIGSTKEDLREIFDGTHKVNMKTCFVFRNNTWCEEPSNDGLSYIVDDIFMLSFNKYNNKLVCIGADEKYKGELFHGIYMGTDVNELLKFDNSFEIGDVDDEIYSDEKCVYIETDIYGKICWISISDREDWSLTHGFYHNSLT